MQIHRVFRIFSTPDMPHPGIAEEEVPIAKFFVRHALVAALFLLFFLQPFFSPSFAMGELVWSVVIKEDAAQLTTNEFAVVSGKLSGTSFPVQNLLVRKVEDLSEGEWRRVVSKAAPLVVNPDGSLRKPALSFIMPGRAGVDPSGRKYTYLALPDDDTARKVSLHIPVRFVDLAESRNQQILGWERSADGHYGVLHAEKTTLFFDATAGAPPGTQIVRRSYDWRTFGPVMSKVSERLALIATDGHREKIVVFKFDGTLVFEEKSFSDYSYSQPFLTSSGETLILDRNEPQRNTETIAIDLRDGSTKVLDVIVKGTRYYSDDGNRFVVLQGGYGKVFYYDSSNPFDPKLLWTYETSRLTTTAAVSEDGAYVALETTSNHPGGQTMSVVVLDSRGSAFAKPLAETRLEGLQFEGDFLFVGTQRHPRPAYLDFTTTTGIEVFHFPNQREGRS